MKKFFLFLILPLSLCAQELDDQIFQLQNNPPPFSPFSATGSYVDVNSTKFRTRGFREDTLKYRQWEAAFVYKHPITDACGLLFGSGWVGAEVNMENNPNFDETIFNYVNLSVGGFTTAFPDWTWTLTVAGFFDTDEFSFVDYALYQGVLWGRYDFCNCLELDFGLIVEAGLNKDKVWPIIGFVYYPSEKWQINAIYPVDISFDYFFNQYLSASGSVRFLRSRHRVRDNEPLSQGIFEYRTTGLEFDLTLAPSLCFSIMGFVGSTVKGDFKVSDRNDKNAIHFKFNGSFYAGASAILNF